MPKGWAARKPNYYLVVFGSTNTEFPIEKGVYPYPQQWGKNVKKGDLLCLYQELSVSGIGVVIDIYTQGEKEIIDYQFFQLDPAKTWDSQLDLKIELPELQTPLYFYTNWIQPINKSSFEKVLEGSKIKWEANSTEFQLGD